MNFLRYFLVPIFCLSICGKALAFPYDCVASNSKYFTEEEASLVFIGKLTSQVQWELLFIENEKGAKNYHSTMKKHTFRVLEVLKGSPLGEEIVFTFIEIGEEPTFQLGKTYKIRSSNNSCLVLVDSLPDDIHGAMK
jgi:hypothetical protein